LPRLDLWIHAGRPRPAGAHQHPGIGPRPFRDPTTAGAWRDHLSRYLAAVRDGQEVTVTDRELPLPVSFRCTSRERSIDPSLMDWSSRQPRRSDHANTRPSSPRALSATSSLSSAGDRLSRHLCSGPAARCRTLVDEMLTALERRDTRGEHEAAVSGSLRRPGASRTDGSAHPAQHDTALAELDGLIAEIDHVEVTMALTRAAGGFARAVALSPDCVRRVLRRADAARPADRTESTPSTPSEHRRDPPSACGPQTPEGSPCPLARFSSFPNAPTSIT